jgi:hypothetical protein
MTGLGATIYFGLFAIAAVWLFVTSDRFGHARASLGFGDADQAQQPDLSNSWSAAVDADGSSPRLISHSSSK